MVAIGKQKRREQRKTVHIAIVGGGIWGLSCAWALLRRGHQVTVVERGTLPNTRAASYDDHRLIRYPYGPQHGYCQKVAAAFDAWGSLWRDLEENHYVETGTLGVCGSPGDWIDASRKGLDGAGVRYEIWDQQKLKRTFPHLTPENVRYAMYLENGGILLADKIMRGLGRWIRANGATVLERRTAVKLGNNMTEVVLHDGATVQADGVLLATGAWLDELLPSYSDCVEPRRTAVVYLEAPAALREVWCNSPIVVDMGARGKDLWAAPAVNGTRIKLGCDALSSAAVASDNVDVQEDEIRRYLEVWDSYLPELSSYKVTGAKSGYYTSGRSQEFLARPLADNHQRSWVLTRCCGHGFKFGPALAEKLATLLHRQEEGDAFIRWASGREDLTRPAKAALRAPRPWRGSEDIA